MKKFAIVLIFCGIIYFQFSHIALSQPVNNTLIFGANVRFRYEYQNNFNQKCYGDNPPIGEANDGFLLGRFRMGINYWYSPKFHLSLWMQDSRVWDNEIPDEAFYKYNFNREHNPYKDYFELWDSYIEIISPFDLPISLKAGRQRIYYGDKRIFGPGEWGNTGRWIWDAIKIAFKFNNRFFDIYYGRTEIHDPDDFSLTHRHGYESIGFYGHFPLFHNLITIEPFSMTKKDSHERYKSETGEIGDLDSYYMGFRGYIKNLKGIKCDFTYIIQRGNYSEDDIDAYAYHFLIGYKFSILPWKPEISAEYSYASGDSNPEDGEHETFDSAFGARDKMYGRMNLFQWMNLKDKQINLKYYPASWISFTTEFHKFYLAEKKDAWYLNSKLYRDREGNSSDKVGKEFDIVAKLNFWKKSEIQIGYGHFWPDEFAKKVASTKEADWIFFLISYNFSTRIF